MIGRFFWRSSPGGPGRPPGWHTIRHWCFPAFVRRRRFAPTQAGQTGSGTFAHGVGVFAVRGFNRPGHCRAGRIRQIFRSAVLIWASTGMGGVVEVQLYDTRCPKELQPGVGIQPRHYRRGAFRCHAPFSGNVTTARNPAGRRRELKLSRGYPNFFRSCTTYGFSPDGIFQPLMVKT